MATTPKTLIEAVQFFSDKANAVQYLAAKRLNSSDLEYLARLDISSMKNKQRAHFVRRLQVSREFALLTERPDRVGWIDVLLRKYSQTKPTTPELS